MKNRVFQVALALGAVLVLPGCLRTYSSHYGLGDYGSTYTYTSGAGYYADAPVTYRAHSYRAQPYRSEVFRRYRAYSPYRTRYFFGGYGRRSYGGYGYRRCR